MFGKIGLGAGAGAGVSDGWFSEVRTEMGDGGWGVFGIGKKGEDGWGVGGYDNNNNNNTYVDPRS